MWKVVYIAQTAEAAARIKEVLAANGFLTQTKTTNSKHGGVYEISVPLSEAEDGHLRKQVSVVILRRPGNEENKNHLHRWSQY